MVPAGGAPRVRRGRQASRDRPRMEGDAPAKDDDGAGPGVRVLPQVARRGGARWIWGVHVT